MEIYIPKTLDEFLDFCYQHDDGVIRESGVSHIQDERTVHFTCSTVERSEIISAIQQHLPYLTYKEYSLSWNERRGSTWQLSINQKPQYTRYGHEYSQFREIGSRGVTLEEANNNFNDQCIQYLGRREQIVAFSKTQPSTINEFVAISQEYGLDIGEASRTPTDGFKVKRGNPVDITYGFYNFSGKAGKLNCKLEINLSRCKTTWAIYRNYPFEVKAEADTLSLALQKYLARYDKIDSDPELKRQAIAGKRRKDEEEESRWDAIQGMADYNYLRSEFGEDVFSDLG